LKNPHFDHFVYKNVLTKAVLIKRNPSWFQLLSASEALLKIKILVISNRIRFIDGTGKMNEMTK